MCKRYLTMIEISQKQSYIFSSNKLKDNIINSAVIAWITHPDYFEKVTADKSVFSIENNLVYFGGGHTVLEFETYEKAKLFTKIVTAQIHRDYNDIEVYAKTIPYRETDQEGRLMTPGDNLKELTKALEYKKSVRRAAFHQGSFGIEKIDSTTLKPVLVQKKSVNKMPDRETRIENELLPENCQYVSRFEELGGDKENSNFIAVVHIDGNAMGQRLENLYEKNKDVGWETFKEKIRNFSKKVDLHFKEAYRDMALCVAQNLSDGRLDTLKLKEHKLPVRRIITAGDDVCFVAEGRIGLECAVAFLRALDGKKNKIDDRGYAACAGVAIVHQKYPFYRAYELAELLCSNAKKFGVSLDAELGKRVSAIDWHIEYGEMDDSLKTIRKKYLTDDGKRMEMRPYIVKAPDEICKKEPMRQYKNFKKLLTRIQADEISYANGKVTKLRDALKHGETEARYFLKFNKMEDIVLESFYDIFKEMDYEKIGTGQGMDRPIFVKTYDGDERSYLYDAIEVKDTYIDLEDLKP